MLTNQVIYLVENGTKVKRKHIRRDSLQADKAKVVILGAILPAHALCIIACS